MVSLIMNLAIHGPCNPISTLPVQTIEMILIYNCTNGRQLTIIMSITLYTYNVNARGKKDTRSIYSSKAAYKYIIRMNAMMTV